MQHQDDGVPLKRPAKKQVFRSGKGLFAAAVPVMAALLLSMPCAVRADGEKTAEKTPDSKENEGESRLLPFPVSGSACLAAVFRFTGNDSDLDFAGSLSLRAGDRHEDTLNAFLSAAFNLDADGGNDTYGYYVFDGHENSFRGAFFGRLLEAGLDLNRAVPGLMLVRVGRQVAETFHAVRFDGLSASTDYFEPARGVKVSANAFGGVPARFYGDSPWGDACFGASVRASFGRTVSLGLHGVWLRDRSSLWADPTDGRSTRLAVAGSWKPSTLFSCSGHFSFMELGASDLQMVPEEFKLAARSRIESLKLALNAEILARFRPAEGAAAEFDPYEAALGGAGASQRARAGVSWLPSKDFELTFMGSAFNSDSADADMASATVSALLRDVPARNLTLQATGEVFDLPGPEFSAGLSGEVSYRLDAGEGGRRRRAAEFRASGGFTPLLRVEQGNEVRENVIFAKAEIRWWPVKDLRVSLEFRFENDDFDAYYRLGLKAVLVF